MPVYEFACSTNECPTYEVWRAISDRDTSTECPECGSEGRRLFNPPMMLTGAPVSIIGGLNSRRPSLPHSGHSVLVSRSEIALHTS